MRRSLVVLAVALSLAACGARTELDGPAPRDAAADAFEVSTDAASDVTVDHAVDAATEVGVSPEAAIDAPADSTPEADVRDAATFDADAAVCTWGGFSPEVTYPEGSPTSTHPTYVAVGDFNRDGHLDFVATSAGVTASVYVNQGDGTFAPQVTYPIGAWTNTVVPGDFNGDGWLDIAAANGLPGCGKSCCNGTCDATVAVLLNRGDGTFGPVALYDSGGLFGSSLAVGDMNGDHVLDFVVVNYNSNTVAVLLGRGDGTFGAAATYPALNPDTIAVADFDGNGTLDVIVGLRSLYPSSFETFFNDGTGVLTTGATYNHGAIQTNGYETASSIVVGHFEGTKSLDVVVSDTVFDDVLLYPNPGNGVLGTPASFDTIGLPSALVASDFNSDGKLDVGTSSYAFPTDGGPAGEWALVLLGDGQGGLSSPIKADDSLPSGITAGDVNGDGYPDLITGNASWVSVLLSQCGSNTSDAGDAAPLDAADASCTVSHAADYANWRPSNSPQSLVDNGDGTITDDNTGLTWMKGPVGETTDGGAPIYPMSLAAAEAVCPCPWRLPQRIELLSIIDYSQYDMALSPLFLTQEADDNFVWTATRYEMSGEEWDVFLVKGTPGAMGSIAFGQVRCVRGSTKPPAARYTLQTSDAGVAEVVDNGTGLVWKQRSEPGTYTWMTAFAQCASPYRLPTISELQTLVDSSRSAPAIDVALFADTGSGPYATASGVGYVYLEGYYWFVDFTDGSADYATSSTGGNQVRCVR